jgi:hypothetical protein
VSDPRSAGHGGRVWSAGLMTDHHPTPTTSSTDRSGRRIVSQASDVSDAPVSASTPLHQRSAATLIGWGLGLTLGGPLASVVLTAMGAFGFAVFASALAIPGAICFAIGVYLLAAKADAAFARYVGKGPSRDGPGPPAGTASTS